MSLGIFLLASLLGDLYTLSLSSSALSISVLRDSVTFFLNTQRRVLRSRAYKATIATVSNVAAIYHAGMLAWEMARNQSFTPEPTHQILLIRLSFMHN